MTSKKWFFTFAATVAVLAAAVMGFNLIADPFGVFKGSFMEWPSYEMTLNQMCIRDSTCAAQLINAFFNIFRRYIHAKVVRDIY